MFRLIYVIPFLFGLGCGESTKKANNEGRVAQFGLATPAPTTVIATAADGLDVPRDLAFHPDRPGELWTVNRAFDGTVLLFEAGTAEQTAEKIVDIYAMHFMEEVSSMAFGANDTFGTCQESRNTYDHQAFHNDFMGPALWSADLEVYGAVNQEEESGLLGSHLDMLHQSPNCMGIEHAHNNAYWVFDGLNGHIVYYDFQADHGPGYDDHSDGIVRRYPEAAVTREPDVPGHLALDHATGWLYVADTGAGRVIRLDTNSGAKTAALTSENEPLAEFSEYTGATVEVFAEGLAYPSGIALTEDMLFVSDNADGSIFAYDLETKAKLGRYETNADGLMGITLGPDGNLWFVDAEANEVVRVDAFTN